MTRVASPRRRPANLVPVDASWERVIRTTVGLRPHRPSGFVLRAAKFDDKTVIHNFGHGGAGMSISWGTGALAAELALAHGERRAAVLGCGVVGLTAARQLQRRGFDVSIYSAALPPYTTSNMSWASFTPTSGLYGPRNRTPEWDAQFREAVTIAYRELQLLVGDRYGLRWVDEYSPTSRTDVVDRARREAEVRASARATQLAADSARRAGGSSRDSLNVEQRGNAPAPLLPDGLELARELLLEGEHPFNTRYAWRFPTLRFEPSIYLDALMRDVIAFGGRIVVRKFDAPRDLMSLNENVIVNCTGLGSKELFSDPELIPVKGQLVVFVPQPEVTYATSNMVPRSDGLVFGHVMEEGVSDMSVNETARARVVEEAIRFFNGMKHPDEWQPRPSAESALSVPQVIPPVEAFFGRES